MGLRGTLGAVLSRGNLDGFPLANTYPKLVMGSELEPAGTASAGVPDDLSRPGSPNPPPFDSNFDSNRDSNGGGHPVAEWTPVESRAAPTPCTVYVPGRRWTSVEPR